MDKTMTAAAWHREQARNQRISGTKFPPASNPARRYAETAAYHDAAAKALEALAVGRLASWWARMAQADAVYGVTITDEERAALATLANIGENQ